MIACLGLIDFDNRISAGLFFLCGSRLAPANSRQSPQHMLCEHVATGEFRALAHQFEKRVLPVPSNEGHVGKVNHQLSTLKLLARAPPGSVHFGSPRRNQLAFQNQPALALRFDNRDLQHNGNVSHDS
jgi:hypothetical protein